MKNFTPRNSTKDFLAKLCLCSVCLHHVSSQSSQSSQCVSLCLHHASLQKILSLQNFEVLRRDFENSVDLQLELGNQKMLSRLFNYKGYLICRNLCCTFFVHLHRLAGTVGSSWPSCLPTSIAQWSPACSTSRQDRDLQAFEVKTFRLKS